MVEVGAGLAHEHVRSADNEPVKRDLTPFCSGESIMAQRRTVLPAVLADAHPTRDVAWQHGPYTVQV
jgi:hypothetical protein